MTRAVALVALLLGAGLAGCLGGDDGGDRQGDDGTLDASNATLDKIASVAAPKRLKYVFPGQEERPDRTLWINGTVGPEGATGYEAPGDRGGTRYNTMIIAEDVSNLVPPGQATLVELRLWWNNGPGRGANIDAYVNLPGVTTSESRAYADEWTWTLPVKELSVVTVGVAGEAHEIGVEVANAKVAPGQEIQYTIRAEFRYAKDVLTPYHPWEVTVPTNASGLILGSMKFGSDAHVRADVLVVGPDGDLVSYVGYNDLAIPTESVYVPVRAAGPHVLYAVDMHGGFLDVRTDAGLEVTEARALSRVLREEVLVTEPVAPGTPGHRINGANTTSTEGGVEVSFDAGPSFPLSVEPVIVGDTTVTGDVDLVVEAQGKLVARYHRFARVDDERGSLGVSDDNGFGNRVFLPENLVRGEMILRAVVDGSTGQAGVRILTYGR